MRRRGPAACLAIALFLAAASSALVEPLVRQAGEIDLDIGNSLWIEPWRTVAGVLVHDPGIRAVHFAFQALAVRPTEPLDPQQYRQLDPDNGLYDYLVIFSRLKSADARDEPLRKEIARLRTAKPACLHLAARFKKAESIFLQSGCPPRVAARGGQCVPYFLKPLHDEYPRVLREGSAALLERGKAWREAGRLDAAVGAHAAVIRLLTDLIADSPTPNTALLASEVLPAAWTELEQDIKASPPARASDLLPAIREHAARVAAIRPQWQQAAADGMNVLPFTGLSYHVMLAVPEHQRVMAAVTSVLLCLIAWLTLLILCLVWLVLAAVASNPRGIDVRWRNPRTFRWVAPAIVCGPFVALILLLHATDLDFTWLFSYPTLGAVMLWPAIVPVLVGLSARLCTTTSDEKLNVPPLRSLLASIVLFCSPALGALLSLKSHAVGSPPAVVSALRLAGLALGVASILILIVRGAVALLRVRRGGFSVFAWSRACLNVTAASLLLMTVIAAAALWQNRQADLRHQEAFVRAATDPLTDRLGRGWFDRAFNNTGSLLQQVGEHFQPDNVAKPLLR